MNETNTVCITPDMWKDEGEGCYSCRNPFNRITNIVPMSQYTCTVKAYLPCASLEQKIYNFFNGNYAFGVAVNITETNVTKSITPPEGINDTIVRWVRPNPDAEGYRTINSFGLTEQEMPIGTSYTISCYARTTSNTSRVQLFLFDRTVLVTGNFNSSTFDVGTNWTRISHTRVRTATEPSLLSPYGRIDSEPSGTNEIYITGVQLENTHFVTPWKPYEAEQIDSSPDRLYSLSLSIANNAKLTSNHCQKEIMSLIRKGVSFIDEHGFDLFLSQHQTATITVKGIENHDYIYAITSTISDDLFRIEPPLLLISIVKDEGISPVDTRMSGLARKRNFSDL